MTLNYDTWMQCAKCGELQQFDRIAERESYRDDERYTEYEDVCPCGARDSYNEAELCEVCEYPVSMCQCVPSVDAMAETIRGTIAQIKRDFEQIIERLNPLINTRKESL